MKRSTTTALGCALLIAGAGSVAGFHRAGEQELKLIALESEESRLRSELSRLRREVASLVTEATRPAHPTTESNPEDEKTEIEVIRFLGAIDDLKGWVSRAQSTPHLPETKFLTPKDWVAAVRVLGDGRTEEDYRNAWLIVRNAALDRTAAIFQQALKDYLDNAGGMFPDKMDELAPYIPGKADPSLLAHYRLVGNAAEKKIILNGRSLCLESSEDSAEMNVSLAQYSSGGTWHMINPPQL